MNELEIQNSIYDGDFSFVRNMKPQDYYAIFNSEGIPKEIFKYIAKKYPYFDFFQCRLTPGLVEFLVESKRINIIISIILRTFYIVEYNFPNYPNIADEYDSYLKDLKLLEIIYNPRFLQKLISENNANLFSILFHYLSKLNASKKDIYYVAYTLSKDSKLRLTLNYSSEKEKLFLFNALEPFLYNLNEHFWLDAFPHYFYSVDFIQTMIDKHPEKTSFFAHLFYRFADIIRDNINTIASHANNQYILNSLLKALNE